MTEATLIAHAGKHDPRAAGGGADAVRHSLPTSALCLGTLALFSFDHDCARMTLVPLKTRRTSGYGCGRSRRPHL